jgi:hypothetical protein
MDVGAYVPRQKGSGGHRHNISQPMKYTFKDVSALANRSAKKTAFFSANAANDEALVAREQEVMISDTTGFHIYGDLHLNLGLAAATDQDKANLFLEVLEDYARIASDFARGRPEVLIFEVQGERLHLFFNRNTANETTISELIDFCAYFTDAVYDIIKPKVGDEWGGFCMAADFGRAIVLSTGADGDDSLISLGKPANAPAKRLARQPQVKSGHLALRTDLAMYCPEIKDVAGRYSVGSWIEVDVKDRPMLIQKSANATILEEAIANSKSASLDRDSRQIVALSAKAEFVDTGRATIQNPTFVQGFILRADLDGFTRRVDAAFSSHDPQAIQLLVVEFLQIMKIPEAFENYVGRPMIRLPWAGDCYNAIFLPKNHEDYDATRDYLPAVVSNHWLDPDGKVNATRDEALAAAAEKNQWAIGIAGGEESMGRLLVANINTWHRSFLVVAGWGSRRSIDAQNADGLKANEAVIHTEDHQALNPSYKAAFGAWSNGPVDYRKATAAALARAEKKVVAAYASVQIAPKTPAIVIPAARPYYGDQH